MIKGILVFNNHGKPRLTKFYTYYVSIFRMTLKWKGCKILQPGTDFKEQIVLYVLDCGSSSEAFQYKIVLLLMLTL